MSPTPTTALTTSSSSASAARTGVRAVATFWHAITGSLLAMHWRLRGFPTGEDPHAIVRELRRRTRVVMWARRLRCSRYRPIIGYAQTAQGSSPVK